MMATDDAGKTNDGGTPLLDADTAHVPEAREDVPPMQRPGMPLYDPALYEESTESDPSAHSEDVRGKRGGNPPTARGEGRT